MLFPSNNLLHPVPGGLRCGGHYVRQCWAGAVSFREKARRLAFKSVSDPVEKMDLDALAADLDVGE